MINRLLYGSVLGTALVTLSTIAYAGVPGGCGGCGGFDLSEFVDGLLDTIGCIF
jgi:hypothetical protein